MQENAFGQITCQHLSHSNERERERATRCWDGDYLYWKVTYNIFPSLHTLLDTHATQFIHMHQWQVVCSVSVSKTNITHNMDQLHQPYANIIIHRKWNALHSKLWREREREHFTLNKIIRYAYSKKRSGKNVERNQIERFQIFLWLEITMLLLHWFYPFFYM